MLNNTAVVANDNSPLNYMTFFSTISLVLITTYYAWQAKKTVDVMEETRISQFTPSFKIVPKFFYIGNEFGLEITNIGVGTAKNIKGKLKLTSNGEETDIFYPSLYPRESLVLGQPFKNVKLNSDTSKDNKVEMYVINEEIAGNTYETKESFSIYYSGFTENENYTRDKIVSELHDIKSELHNINKQFSNLKGVVNRKY